MPLLLLAGLFAEEAVLVRVGRFYIVQVFANQTRRAMGLEDPMSLDTDAAVRVGVQGLRKLIQRDKAAL